MNTFNSNNYSFNFPSFSSNILCPAQCEQRPNQDATQLTQRIKKVQHRQKFSQVEDQILTQLVKQFGQNKWEEVAKHLLNRTAKQCKDHYMNYIMPCYVHTAWTNEEDMILERKFKEFGPKWTKMTGYFNGRSANSIKNRWNYYLSKQNKDKFVSKAPKALPVATAISFASAATNEKMISVEITSSEENSSYSSGNSSPVEETHTTLWNQAAPKPPVASQMTQPVQQNQQIQQFDFEFFDSVDQIFNEEDEKMFSFDFQNESTEFDLSFSF